MTEWSFSALLNAWDLWTSEMRHLSLIFLLIFSGFLRASDFCDKNMDFEQRLLTDAPIEASATRSILATLQYLSEHNVWTAREFGLVAQSPEPLDLSQMPFALKNIPLQRKMKEALADLWKQKAKWEWEVIRKEAEKLEQQKRGKAGERRESEQKTEKVFFPVHKETLAPVKGRLPLHYPFVSREGESFISFYLDEKRSAEVLELHSHRLYPFEGVTSFGVSFYQGIKGSVYARYVSDRLYRVRELNAGGREVFAADMESLREFIKKRRPDTKERRSTHTGLVLSEDAQGIFFFEGVQQDNKITYYEIRNGQKELGDSIEISGVEHYHTAVHVPGGAYLYLWRR